MVDILENRMTKIEENDRELEMGPVSWTESKRS